MPVILYPRARRFGCPGCEAWFLAWPALNAEWRPARGSRVWAGAGVITTACASTVFHTRNGEMERGEGGHEGTWNTFQTGFSKPVGSIKLGDSAGNVLADRVEVDGDVVDLLVPANGQVSLQVRDTANNFISSTAQKIAWEIWDMLGNALRIGTGLNVDFDGLPPGILQLRIIRDTAPPRTVTVRTPKIEKMVVNGDFPTADWSAATGQAAIETIYAGDQNGDMVSWRVDGLTGTVTYTWSATGPDNITGPTGSGVTEWKIAVGGNDPVRQRVDWKPGIYTIKCRLDSAGGATQEVQIQQEVGWRTDEYVVVGQVKPLNDITLTSMQASVLQANIVTDVAAFTPWAGLLIYPPLEHVTFAWFVAQAIMTNGFSNLRVANLPDVGDNERLWMTQFMLNLDPDLFDVPNSFEPETLFQLTQAQSYRMYCRIQFKYTVGSDGKIFNAFQTPLSIALNGPTKILTVPSYVVTAFDWLKDQLDQPYLNLPTQIQIPSEPATTSTTRIVDRQGGRLASFVGGRIGPEGQYANYALFRRTVPYIFAETIFTLDADGKASQQTIRLSVDKVWQRNGTEIGSRFFNEIRIFRRRAGISGAPFEVERILSLSANPGQLREFIFSVPLLTWSGVEPQPTVPITQ